MTPTSPVLPPEPPGGWPPDPPQLPPEPPDGWLPDLATDLATAVDWLPDGLALELLLDDPTTPDEP